MATESPSQHHNQQTPDVLVVGNACIDRQHAPDGGEEPIERLGGACAFASRVAALGGAQVGMVAAGSASFNRLRDLATVKNLWLEARMCAKTTVFEVYGCGPGQTRREQVVSAARPLVPRDVPPAWKKAPVAYVAPVLGECDAALVASLHAPIVVIGAQGWLRTVDADGWVEFAQTPQFVAPPANTTAMVFSEADHPRALQAAQALAQQGILAVVTQSSRGGVIFARGRRPQRYAAASAIERDTTGAGDCFGIVFALALAQKMSLRAAASLAARTAARVVEGPELGTLPGSALQLVRREARISA